MASPGRGSPSRGCRQLSKRRRPVVGELGFGKRTCKPNSVVCGHSSRRRVAADARQRPTRRFRQFHEPPERIGPMRSVAWLSSTLPRRPVAGDPADWRLLPSLFGLAPCGVYPASAVTVGAVRSYRTFSPLPDWTGPKTRLDRRYLLCGTGRPRALTPASRTLSGTLPCGVRTFLPRRPPKRGRQRPPGPPA